MAKAKTKKMTIEDALVPVEEQPYEVPNNWCWVRVGKISSIYTGNSINERVKKEKYEGQEDGLLFIATKDVDFDNSINYETNVRITDYDNFKRAPENTALLCIEGGSAGRKIGFTNQEVCFGNKLCAFSTKDANPKYVYYYLQSNAFLYQFNDRKHGLIGGVSVKDMITIPIPLPPLAEQHRIVEQIEYLFAKLDEAKEKVQLILETNEQRINAVLYRAFSGELTKEWRKTHNVSDSTWVHSKIGDVATFHQGLQVPVDNQFETSNEDRVRFIRIIDYTQGNEPPRFVLKKNLSQEVFVSQNDIVMVRYGASAGFIGDGIDGVIANNMFKIIVEDNMVDYVKLYLKSPYMFNVLNTSGGASAMPALNFKTVSGIPIDYPEAAERREICKIISPIIDSYFQMGNICETVVSQIDIMKKSILAKAFRGELGTNNPSEENSMELLKQIIGE